MGTLEKEYLNSGWTSDAKIWIADVQLGSWGRKLSRGPNLSRFVEIT